MLVPRRSRRARITSVGCGLQLPFDPRGWRWGPRPTWGRLCGSPPRAPSGSISSESRTQFQGARCRRRGHWPPSAFMIGGCGLRQAETPHGRDEAWRRRPGHRHHRTSRPTPPRERPGKVALLLRRQQDRPAASAARAGGRDARRDRRACPAGLRRRRLSFRASGRSLASASIAAWSPPPRAGCGTIRALTAAVHIRLRTRSGSAETPP